MLSKPIHGWTNVTIGDFAGRASYTTDVPMDCLMAFINALEYNIPASIFFDEEGTEFTLVASFNYTYVIEERQEPKLIIVNKRFLSLAKELVNDIENNLEDWVIWYDYYDGCDEEYKDMFDKRRKLIKERVSRLKESMKLEEKNLRLN